MLSDYTYLVTGAAGHLGTALVKRLTEAGCAVRALCVEGERHPPENARVYTGDVRRRETLGAFFADIEGARTVVIHCAGIVSIASKYVQNVYDVNVLGTRNVTALCEERGVKKLIYVSSVHAIPEKPHGEVIAETGRFSPDDVAGLYAKTKAEATACVLAAAARGLDAEVVFPAGIIGPYDYGRSHTNQLVADYVGGRLGAAVRGGYDFVDVRDVADGILACVEKGRPGEGYILSGGYRSIRELLGILHELTGRREIRVYLPVWFLNWMAPLCEAYYRARHEPPLFTRYSIYTLATNSAFDNAKARAALGFAPRDIRETLRDTVAWLKSRSVC